MSIQFLDLRISEARNNSSGTSPVPTTPTLFGDIGLQTAAVVGTANQNNVRVALWGTVGISAASAGLITITVERNSGDTPGSGSLIYTLTTGLAAREFITFHAGDFPPTAEVTNQIRYTMFLSSSVAGMNLDGPISFGGIAAAGTTDGSP
ncbi:hypothetical protein [Cohnella sp. OV330]|uniref:hypothetical protein n=1 Tax=Cohnella sp. OV330 TaxID=1855288 RepID=UPI00116069A2|nr:hypothetical protein [Cohnella sp. OV330]